MIPFKYALIIIRDYLQGLKTHLGELLELIMGIGLH